MRSRAKKASFLSRFTIVYAACAFILVAISIGAVYYHQAEPNAWCLPFEQQDWELGYCYATCSDAASCAALDEKYKIIQDTFSNEDRIWYYDFSPVSVETPEDAFIPSIASHYTINTVKNGKLGEIIEASSTKRFIGYNTRTWDLLSYILPSSAAKSIAEFAGYADITGSTGAFVMPTDETSRTWGIYVNYVSFYTPRNTLFDRGATIHTLVHEIGHVMTLTDAFEPGTYTIDLEGNSNGLEITCYTTRFVAGCAKVGSYLAVFAARFWQEAKGDGETSGEYSPDKFVSGYAATNIPEDMAESWAAFVLLDKPTGSTISDKKVLFFYEYPEFVAARAHILNNINRLH